MLDPASMPAPDQSATAPEWFAPAKKNPNRERLGFGPASIERVLKALWLLGRGINNKKLPSQLPSIFLVTRVRFLQTYWYPDR